MPVLGIVLWCFIGYFYAGIWYRKTFLPLKFQVKQKNLFLYGY
ncbi:hypothetical protein SALWKB12_1658 [Snodgrassella communis]|uniref:Uncharacterized protein n=1 Tax=Snodgrassella communis TaxID=2946699 RepID=A0A836MR46_9NEIS|nr:hypothetical protein SALWKB12_1658 [Snodgrassella communis]KDN14607.1 hypothetical protein SALWKB29_1397 [Snodgrassella communis]